MPSHTWYRPAVLPSQPRCPACDAPLGDSRGFVKRLPPRCPDCEAELRYDTAGGIHAYEPALRRDDDTEETKS